MSKIIKLSSLADARRELLKISEIDNVKSENWSPYKIFVHCAQTIEYSMTGYPVMKSKVLRYTIGKIAIKKFIGQGFMKHDLAAPVPGAPVIEDVGTVKEGVEILINAIKKFEAFNKELSPHLMFGKLSKNDYDQYFSFHIEDHLSELEY